MFQLDCNFVWFYIYVTYLTLKNLQHMLIINKAHWIIGSVKNDMIRPAKSLFILPSTQNHGNNILANLAEMSWIRHSHELSALCHCCFVFPFTWSHHHGLRAVQTNNIELIGKQSNNLRSTWSTIYRGYLLRQKWSFVSLVVLLKVEREMWK